MCHGRIIAKTLLINWEKIRITSDHDVVKLTKSPSLKKVKEEDIEGLTVLEQPIEEESLIKYHLGYYETNSDISFDGIEQPEMTEHLETFLKKQTDCFLTEKLYSIIKIRSDKETYTETIETIYIIPIDVFIDGFNTDTIAGCLLKTGFKEVNRQVLIYRNFNYALQVLANARSFTATPLAPFTS